MKINLTEKGDLMSYGKKPKMILFDVGGTLFNGGKFLLYNGLEKLRLAAENPDVTDTDALVSLWEEFLDDVNNSLKSKSGTTLDMPLSAVIRYMTMNTGLYFSLSMPEQEEIFDRYNSERRVIDGVPELLNTIRSLGIRSAVISNNAMSGDGLALAVNHWIKDNYFEFCLTSSDLLLSKPDKRIFEAAAAFAGVDTKDCWYCGDGFVPDVYGSFNSSMTPVLIDVKSSLPLEMRKDDRGEYMAVNSWKALSEFLMNLEQTEE